MTPMKIDFIVSGLFLEAVIGILVCFSPIVRNTKHSKSTRLETKVHVVLEWEERHSICSGHVGACRNLSPFACLTKLLTLDEIC